MNWNYFSKILILLFSIFYPIANDNSLAKNFKEVTKLSRRKEFFYQDINKLINKADKAEKNFSFKKSLEINYEVLNLKKRKFGHNSLQVANSFYKIGKLLNDLNQFNKARSFLFNSLEIYKLDYEYQEKELIYVILEVCRSYIREGLFEDSINFYKENFELVKNSYEINQELIAIFLNDLGLMYSDIGKYELAKSIFLNSIVIFENYNAKNLDTFSLVLNNLGLVHTYLGEYAKAEENFLKSLEIEEHNFKYDNERIGLIKNNLGYLYSEKGLYVKAERFYLEALNMAEKIYGNIHPNVSVSKNNLAELYSRQKLYSKAEKLYLEAINNFEINFPENKVEIGTFLNNLAANYNDQNLLSKAESAYMKALKYTEINFGADHHKTAILLNNLGLLFYKKKEFNKAENLYLKSLNINKKHFGDKHPKVFANLSNLIFNYMDSGNSYKAIRIAKEYYTNKLSYIQKEASFLSLEDRQLFKNEFGANNLPFSFINFADEGIGLAAFYRLNNHGLLQEIEKRQLRVKNLKDDQKAIFHRISFLNKQISSRKINNEKIDFLIKEKVKLEKKIYRLIPEIKPKIYSVETIANYLPDNSALIEYQKYIPSFKNPNKESKYLAIVIKKNAPTEVIELGLAKDIENKIMKAYKHSSSLPEFNDHFEYAQKAWNEVGDLIIKPLRKSVKALDTLFISPDSEINNVPFTALASFDGEKFLVDSFNLRLLTTGRELLNLFEEKKDSKVYSNNSIVFANPNFNKYKKIIDKRNNKGEESKGKKNLTIMQKKSMIDVSKKWHSLPGTSKEGLEISNLINAKYFEKDRASVIELERQNKSKVIHIASHAFFLENTDSKILNPMLRSGIVLSGANFPYENPQDDGYLMASEIARLDWEDTEMVVISACDSGRGQFFSGEGIYGLKRAINLAGSKSSLLSFWKVNDQSTAAFMKSFYEKLISGKGRSDALIDTQREFRNHKNEIYRHPYVWAAFQLSGDWRPINLSNF